MKRLNIGIVGTGKFAHVHAQAIQSLKNAYLKAVCSQSAIRAESFSRRYGIIGYSDLDKFLADADIDIVDIVTVHNLHTEIGIKAALARKHLIIEKPIATTLKDADNLISICQKTGTKLSVVSQHRYDQAYQKAKHILDSNELGKIIFACVLMRWHRPESYFLGQGEWLAKKACAGGGVLMTQAIHLIDIITWLLGPINKAIGYIDTKTHQIEVEDTSVALLEFKNGAQGIIMATISVSGNMTDRLEIHGEKGSIIIEDHEFFEYIRPSALKIEEYLRKIGFKMKKSLPFNIAIRRRMACGRIVMQIREVVDNLINGLPVPNPGEEAREVLKLILSIYDANRNFRKII